MSASCIEGTWPEFTAVCILCVAIGYVVAVLLRRKR